MLKWKCAQMTIYISDRVRAKCQKQCGIRLNGEIQKTVNEFNFLGLILCRHSLRPCVFCTLTLTGVLWEKLDYKIYFLFFNLFFYSTGDWPRALKKIIITPYQKTAETLFQ